ncbi:MAG: YggT family protein [Chloroflexi bacterium]|nr:YggT family protein [Chloroflexota bacterium]MBE3119415.1 YggT family protein [Candidatus Atribacteria bacterium]
MIIIIAKIISTLANLIILLVIVDSILSFILSPYHPVRNALDRVLRPLLAPIRRIVPLVGMFDLSPLILIILVEILFYALISFLYAL